MSKSKQSRFEKNVIITLSVITNLFIIAGVSRHWNYHDNTKLATPQQETAQIQEEASYDTGCQSTYQSAYQ
tara:strand:+ start:536 stop:748 length:213 start_codon:yes stop_codon:yes gene_type:complete